MSLLALALVASASCQPVENASLDREALAKSFVMSVNDGKLDAAASMFKAESEFENDDETMAGAEYLKRVKAKPSKLAIVGSMTDDAERVILKVRVDDAAVAEIWQFELGGGCIEKIETDS